MVHFGYTLGTVWVHFCSKLYPNWYTLGTVWVQFGYIFTKNTIKIGVSAPSAFYAKPPLKCDVFQNHSWLNSSLRRMEAGAPLMSGMPALPPLPEPVQPLPPADGCGAKAKKRKNVMKKPAAKRARLIDDDEKKSEQSLDDHQDVESVAGSMASASDGKNNECGSAGGVPIF